MMRIPACHGQAGALWVFAVASSFAFAAHAGDIGQAALPQMARVSTRAAILKDNPNEAKRVPEWIATFMEAKERKAALELDVIRKTVQAEEGKRMEDERERRRREENYKRSIGEYVSTKKDDKGSSRIKLDFQVPEIETYRVATDVCLQYKALSDSLADFLSRLDRDGDGKLGGDDYTDAGAATSGSSKVLQPIDANADGLLSEDELDASKKLPRNAATALRAGRAITQVPAYKIKTFDKDANGELSTDEYKSMVMTYVEASLRLESDAAFYKQLADSLVQARAVSAARYAELEVAPATPATPAPGPKLAPAQPQ